MHGQENVKIFLSSVEYNSMGVDYFITDYFSCILYKSKFACASYKLKYLSLGKWFCTSKSLKLPPYPPSPRKVCVYEPLILGTVCYPEQELNAVLTSHLNVPIFICRSHKHCCSRILLSEFNARTFPDTFN